MALSICAKVARIAIELWRGSARGSAAFTFRLYRSGLRASLRRIPRREIPSADFCAQRKRPAGRGRWLCSSRRSTRRNDARRSTLRAICEASRGRQLRLIRAETDSGRSDGLLNALTCRQPSARDFTSSVVDDVTELFAPIAPSKLRVWVSSRFLSILSSPLSQSRHSIIYFLARDSKISITHICDNPVYV